MKWLQISKDVSLPLDAVTQAIGFLGRRGSGKTYAATKLAELMLEAGAQVVAIDPVGVWYGLRLGDGFDVPVLGGLRGDIPLEPTSGALVADLVVERRTSAILDTSQMLGSEQVRFATDFATRFFQRKKAAPSAVHLFVEECQEFVPQNCQRGEERMLHAFERLVKLGRNFGIGVSLISQRPQEVNKKALNQTELLFVFQMTGPQERKTIEGWIADKGIDEDIAALLPKLAVGEPHVWSPQWLDVSKTIRIAPKRSLDASSTPNVGAKSTATKPLTPIDMDALRQAMSESIERAKADDPKELRRRIAELEKQLAAKPAAPPQPAPLLTAKEAALLTSFLHGFDVLQLSVNALSRALAPIPGLLSNLAGRRWQSEPDIRFEEGQRDRREPRRDTNDRARPPPLPAAVQPPPKETLRQKVGRLSAGGDAKVGSGERRMLAVLAEHGRCSKKKTALLAGFSVGGGTFAKYLSNLRTAELVTGSSELELTAAGRAQAGDVAPMPRGRAAVAEWIARLGKGQGSEIVAVLADAGGGPLARDDVARRAGYEPSGGTFAKYLSTVRTIGLVEGKGELRLAEALR